MAIIAGNFELAELVKNHKETDVGEYLQSMAVSQYQLRKLRTHGLGSANMASPDFQVQISENGSTHLQLEQQRIRCRHHLSSGLYGLM